MKTFALRWQDAMTTKDWIMMAVLIVVSASLWMWVLNEYQKPVVDPTWVSSHVSSVPPPADASEVLANF